MAVTVTVELPHGFQTQIDEADWPRVKSLTLYRGTNGYCYFSTWKNGRSNPETLHRWLLRAPRRTHVDHINGDKLYIPSDLSKKDRVKLAGNAVTPPSLTWIMGRLIRALESA